MKALIIGATGATGKDLVNVLLQDNTYTEVVIFVRRPTKITHPKLEEILTDFDDLEKVSADINGDVLFICLGTTLKAAGSTTEIEGSFCQGTTSSVTALGMLIFALIPPI